MPLAEREQVLALAMRLRTEHRRSKQLQQMIDDALASYRTRILDNVDLDRWPDQRSRALVVARAMIDRGDTRAFALGRRMLAHFGASKWP